MSDRLTISGQVPVEIRPESIVMRHRRIPWGRGVLMAMLLATVMPAEAQVMEWLSSRSGKSKKAATTEVRVVAPARNAMTAAEDQKIVGNNLDSFKFAQSHWTSSKDRLEKACRAVSSRYNDNGIRDMLQKLYVIDTQLFRENIRNSALAVNEVKRANESIRQGIVDLNRIITAPGQETLAALEAAVDKVGSANVSQTLLVKKYLTGAEKTIQMAQASYETLELIPSLSVSGLDLLVQMSKQLMRMTQSNSEAFKGLLLNVQTGTEQVSSGLDNIRKTVRETLRFSDHFAIKQFPLVNLPAPTREKVYIQLNTLANSVRGVENTVSIGDSQVRNNAQQFTHLISGYVAKAAESLKYMPANGNEKPLEQISSYARNQVSGLFLRIKEDISSMRTDMAKAARPVAGNLPPAVKFESREDFAARKAVAASSDKLPLFLLGGGRQNTAKATEKQSEGLIVPDGMIALSSPEHMSRKSSGTAVRPAAKNRAVDLMTDEVEISALLPNKSSGNTQVLYQEKPAVDSGFDFVQSELNILNQELGGDFFFGSSGENSKSSLMARGGDDMPSFGLDDETGEDSADGSMQMSYGGSDSYSEPEIELLRIDADNASGDYNENMPMMKFDGDIFNLED